MAARVLIVDDDPAECRHLEKVIRGLGYVTESVAGGEAALTRLARKGAPPVAAVILDLVMPDVDGMAVLERLQRESQGVPVIVQTAAASADAAGSAMRLGAFDFLVKPGSVDRIKTSLANAFRLGALEGEIVRMRRSRSGTLRFSDIVGDTPATERVLRLAERAARSANPVLIEGERGVGKELLARAVHGSSGRRGRGFVMLSGETAGQAELEAALFGPEADTGGRSRPSDASGGTLYIDEIGALPPAAQARLVAFFDGRDRDNAPGERTQRNDICVIAAASHPLIDLVSAGRFREDLFYRLSVTPIWLPPLRERRGEIPHLARRILARLGAEEVRSGIFGISTAATDLLSTCDWPGNFRELESSIFRAMMLCEGSELSPLDFPQLGARSENGSLPQGNRITVAARIDVADQEQAVGEKPSLAAPRADTRIAARYGVARLLDERGEMRPFEVLEEEVIRFAIDHYRGQMSEVARRLGIGRSTLYRKVRDYGIAPEEAA